MNQQFYPGKSKGEVFSEVVADIETSLEIADKDLDRPWGGFLVIAETDAVKFIERFFPELSIEELILSGKLSPKILMVAPNKKLSWQYHGRRSEVWKLIRGTAGVVRSDDDTEKELIVLQSGDIIALQQGERHRLVGLDNWGIVAEIWRHTDAQNPSDEDDIVRLQDDFGR